MRFISFLALIALTTDGHAGYFDGNKLYELCSSEKGDELYYMNASECRAYVTGVADTLDGFSFCIPNQVTRGQNADIVTKFLSEHPEDRHRDGHAITAQALSLAFPCSTKK
ncbi:Rap1a/Tai family immunity protein [Aeromonas jandaei]|uniref:Rap1a/Tai family immunity protein n=1 Tax=Aeromonas jandaei TaxID=650 RepID=UPI0039C5CA30